MLFVNTVREDNSVDTAAWFNAEAETEIAAVKEYLHKVIDTFPDKVCVAKKYPVGRPVVVMSYRIEYPQGKQRDPRITTFQQG